MKILVDADHILEYILNRSYPDNDLSEKDNNLSEKTKSLSEKVESLWTLINKNKDIIEASLTIQGFNKINDILSIFSQENAEKVATRLKFLFKICDNRNSGCVFSPIRQHNDIEKAIELISFYEHGFDALVTEQSSRYKELILPSSYVQILPKKYNEKHGEKFPFI